MNRIIPLWPDTAPYSEYSPEQAQPSLKEFKVEGSKGAVVVCPGGGYQYKAPYEGDPISEMLNEAGISAYTLDYRVVPCHHEAPLTDALRAIRLLRSMGYEKIGILGFSAGAHISCSAATLYTPGDPDAADPVERFSSRPDAFVPCYSPVDVTKRIKLAERLNSLNTHPDTAALAERFSANYHITSETPPAFIWHTSTDEIVPVRNALILADALYEKEIPFELHIYPEGRHGLAICKDRPDVGMWIPQCKTWLLALGFGC